MEKFGHQVIPMPLNAYIALVCVGMCIRKVYPEVLGTYLMNQKSLRANFLKSDLVAGFSISSDFIHSCHFDNIGPRTIKIDILNPVQSVFERSQTFTCHLDQFLDWSLDHSLSVSLRIKWEMGNEYAF